MSSKLHILEAMLYFGTFHHATYREYGTVWEGLYIYPKGNFRGYGGPVLCFNKGDPDLNVAYEMTRKSGISVGSYGNG